MDKKKKEKFKNPYKNQMIAMIKKPIHVNTDFCGIFQEIEETDKLRCGLYNIDIEKDDIYNTLYVTYKPIKNNRYVFNDVHYQIYEYDKNPTTNIVEIDPNKIFDYQEIFKAQGFVDFINRCLITKEAVEFDPFTFYIKYNKCKIRLINGKWYKNDEEIEEYDLLEFFYSLPWEYDDRVKLKKYNIFKRLKNLL